MPLRAAQDIYRCLHFVDDWEEDSWEDYDNDQFGVAEGTAHF